MYWILLMIKKTSTNIVKQIDEIDYGHTSVVPSK